MMQKLADNPIGSAKWQVMFDAVYRYEVQARLELRSLARRVLYGGKKGRRAVRRIGLDPGVAEWAATMFSIYGQGSKVWRKAQRERWTRELVKRATES